MGNLIKNAIEYSTGLVWIKTEEKPGAFTISVVPNAGTIDFFSQAKSHENLKVELIEHDDGHIIPEKIVKQLIHKLKFHSGDKL